MFRNDKEKDDVQEKEREDVKEKEKDDVNDKEKDDVQEKEREDVQEKEREDVKEKEREDVKEKEREDVKEKEREDVKEKEREDVKEKEREDVKEKEREEELVNVKDDVQEKVDVKDDVQEKVDVKDDVQEDDREKDNVQDNKTIYSDDDNNEYGFIPTQKQSDTLLSGVLRIIAFTPIIVSFLSLSHLIRKIPRNYLLVGCLLASIHFFLSFIFISALTKKDDSSYTSITSNCFPLSLVVGLYLVILKFLTCIFMVDMLLATIGIVFPVTLSRTVSLLVMTVCLVLLILIYKNVSFIPYASNVLVVVAGVCFLVCVAFYSKLGARDFVKATSQGDLGISSLLFLCFSFISFSCECHSVTVMTFKKAQSTTLLILVSVPCVLGFLGLLLYFGEWLLSMTLKETLETILSSLSDLNRSLRDTNKDTHNILSRVSLVSCLVLSLVGFILQMDVLSRSLVGIFTNSEGISWILDAIILIVVVGCVVWLVLVGDIGRLLWWTTKVLFFGFPFYAMYPYVAQICDKSNKTYSIFSLVCILCICFFAYLSFINVSILNPSII